MIGEPVRMDLLIAADDVGAGSLACCEIMGGDPRRIRHLRLAQSVGMAPRSVEAIRVNAELRSFRTHRFRLERTAINYIPLMAFHSRTLTSPDYSRISATPSPATSPIEGEGHTS